MLENNFTIGGVDNYFARKIRHLEKRKRKQESDRDTGKSGN